MAADKKIALTNEDIEDALHIYNVETISYDDIPRYHNVVDMFEENDSRHIIGNNCKVIFIPSDKRDIGHFVCVLMRTPTLYEWFDSTGIPPDMANELLNEKEENKEKRYFTDLIKRSGSNIKFIFNESELQPLNGSNTCGKWIVSRIFAMKTSLKDYLEVIDSIEGMSPDTAIAKLYTIPSSAHQRK